MGDAAGAGAVGVPNGGDGGEAQDGGTIHAWLVAGATVGVEGAPQKEGLFYSQ